MKHYLKVPSIPREESTVSILEHKVTLVGSKGSAECRALFDSGASYSIVRRNIAERIAGLEPVADPEDWTFETAQPGDLIQATHKADLEVRFADSEAIFSDQFVVFDELPEDVIIGAHSMQAWQIRLDFKAEEVMYRKTAIRLRV